MEEEAFRIQKHIQHTINFEDDGEKQRKKNRQKEKTQSKQPANHIKITHIFCLYKYIIL